MAHDEASRKASLAGLVALEDASHFYLLLAPGCTLRARGGSWEDAFARLAAVTAQRAPTCVEQSHGRPIDEVAQRGLFDWQDGAAGAGEREDERP